MGMIVPGSVSPMMAVTVGGDPLDDYGRIARSLRTRSAASANLTRTFGVPTSQNIFTYRNFLKRGRLGVAQNLFGASTNHSLGFNAGDQIALTINGTTYTSTALFRDPAAFLDLIYSQNGTTYTVSVNGAVVMTGTSVANTAFNTAIAHQLCSANSANYFDGYSSHVCFIDGQALAATSFGVFHPQTLQWRPKSEGVIKAVVDAGGANSCFLTFGDPTNTTTLCADASSKGNNWTSSNVSLTAGATYDSMLDTPTANCCVWNPIIAGDSTKTGGNLDAAGTARGTHDAGLIACQWEVTANAASVVGGVVSDAGSTNTVSIPNGSTYGFRLSGGTLEYTTNGSGWTSIATGLSGIRYPYASGGSNTLNCGQRAMAYALSAGYKALNTKNLPVIPASGIMRSDDHVDIHLRTGTGGATTIAGKRFPPGVVWAKGRSGATSHALYDIVRGATKDLTVDTTAVEATQTTGLTAFNSDGYSLGALAKLNTNAATYLDFLLRAGDSTVTNTAGSISAQVSANVKAGVSVITFTGTGANATVGHGLGKKPTFFIVKNLDYNLGGFNVYHAALGATKRLLLDLPDGEATVATAWNNTEPTSSVIHLGSLNSVNNSGDRIVIYAFTDIDGFSKAFNYTGTAAADGPFVGLGFAPLTAFIKNASASVNWVWYNRRSIPRNVANVYLEPDTADVETDDGTGATARMVDLVSNGIKARTSGADAINSTGANHVGFAIGEFHFRYANAR